MSYTRGTSTITSKGLIYHLDIMNPLCNHTTKCYSLKNQETGDLINGLKYSIFNGKGSLEFNGIDHYIDLNENFNFIDEQSIEVWIKPNSTGPTYQRILDKSEGNNALKGYALIYHPILNMVYYIVNDGINKDMVACKIPSNKWVNIVTTKNNNTYKIYINGELKNQNTGNSNFLLTNNNLRIGAYTQSNEKNFKGNLSIVKIFNNALTSKEVNINYKALKGRFK